MRLRWMGLALAVALALPMAAAAQERAAALARIKVLNQKAMEEYDGLEFEAARNLLEEALRVARSAAIVRGPTLVGTHLNLGIVLGAGLNDRVGAIKHFGEALRLDPKVSIEPARSTPVLEEMFKAAGETLPPRRAPGSSFRHTPLERGTVGRPIQVRAEVAPELGARRVMLHFRVGSASEYQSVPMEEETAGEYSAMIPGTRVRGSRLEYYIEAQDEFGQRLAGSGEAQNPRRVELRPRDGGRPVAPRFNRFSISITAGTGVGIVYGGQSEHMHPFAIPTESGLDEPVDVGPGLALAALHVAPEISWHINPGWELAAMGRLQLVNATTEKSPMSFLGLLRAKYHVGSGALHGLFSFGGGGGQVRHRIPLGDYDQGNIPGQELPNDAPNDIVDTRVAGMGALALGAGLRYMFTAHVGFIAELNLLFLFPQFAANADINTGLIFSF